VTSRAADVAAGWRFARTPDHSATHEQRDGTPLTVVVMSVTTHAWRVSANR
jgi:hypothetical protein